MIASDIIDTVLQRFDTNIHILKYLRNVRLISIVFNCSEYTSMKYRTCPQQVITYSQR